MQAPLPDGDSNDSPYTLVAVTVTKTLSPIRRLKGVA